MALEVTVKEVKDKFGIIGTDAQLDQAIDTAIQVAPIQLSVLIIGESGSGKDVFSRIIHQYSNRKNKNCIAVNCGGIPEGTIDSELFGHEKGAFTGAVSARKGYFEEADGGTIFLDEIGELPLSTQAKLLRVLERGEYIRVGSSDVKKTNVRIVAATNVDLEQAIKKGKFREDLFYRLNGIMIRIPALRNRRQDIPALFHKFTSDFSAQNRIPSVHLTEHAQEVLKSYNWPGNIRQLKNIAEQITVLAKDKTERIVDAEEVERFIPMTQASTSLVMDGVGQHSYSNERELLFKVLFDMRKDVTDLKKLVMNLLNNKTDVNMTQESERIIKSLYQNEDVSVLVPEIYTGVQMHKGFPGDKDHDYELAQENDAKVTEIGTDEVQTDATCSIPDNEKELIKRALEKYGGNRRRASRELGISERTLYRKIDAYELNI